MKTIYTYTTYLGAVPIITGQFVHTDDDEFFLDHDGARSDIQSFANGIHKRWPNNLQGRPARNKRSVWNVPTRSFRGAHFATYPEVLIIDCIKAGCPPGDVVLDPFFGVATTGLVARSLGRNYIGIELNLNYVKIAEA